MIPVAYQRTFLLLNFHYQGVQNFSKRLNGHPFLLLSESLYSLNSYRMNGITARPPLSNPHREVIYMAPRSSFLTSLFLFCPSGRQSKAELSGFENINCKAQLHSFGSENRLKIYWGFICLTVISLSDVTSMAFSSQCFNNTQIPILEPKPFSKSHAGFPARDHTLGASCARSPFLAFTREYSYFKTQGVNPYKYIFSAKISPHA